ncbi:phosphotransferase [Halioglobus sp. HI00S01]|uniref:phosphotransferase n=1 Tax=Halioglobus sp. HI00S01 TaxID=1822214 RepID=UPI00351082FF
MLLTDLDAAGFDDRKQAVDLADIHACLDWLAAFHATFLGSDAIGLWECGTYWHLDTRPDELAALTDIPLREAAPHIDAVLRRSDFQTLVHGDAKLANFCFATIGGTPRVAAVDFQYVGAGCGMKDVAYFIGSCLDEAQCAALETALLDYYFGALGTHARLRHPAIDHRALEAQWRELYDVAWADFHRFVKGWSPGHWKINSYSEQLARRVIRRLS